MPLYLWEGTGKDGMLRTGDREAPNEDALNLWLRSQNIKVKKVSVKGKKFAFDINKLLPQSVPQKTLVVFARQFSTMIDAGLPLVQCLQILQAQEPHKRFKSILARVQSDVEQGSTFADALKKHPKVFDTLFVNLIAAGEVGGILDTIMLRLATYLENAAKLKKKVKSAMTYPIGISVVAFVVVSGLLKFVVPTFQNMFLEMGGPDAKLPALTQKVIDMSEFFKSNIVYIIVLMIGLFIAWGRVRASDKGRVITDTIFFRAPIFGPLIVKVAVARFCRTMGTMLSSGVPILDALDIVARTAGNKVVERAIIRTKEKISEGKTMAEPMMETGVFPSMVCQMVQVGESTGAVDQMLSKIADFYDEEVDTAVGTLTSLMEPLMMVVLGGIVGGVVMAMYLPVFSMAGTASKNE